MNMTNEEFITAIFGGEPDGIICTIWFYESPSDQKWWIAKPWPSCLPDKSNNYLCYSTFKPTAISKTSTGRPKVERQKKHFQSLYAIMLDDIGTGEGSRCNPSVFGDTSPTLIVETSPGNFQWIFKLDQPISESIMVDRIWEAIKAFGQTDKGSSGLTCRIGRMPNSANTKYDKCHEVTVTEYNPGKVFSIDDFLKLIGQVLPPVTPVRKFIGEFDTSHSLEVLAKLKELGLYRREMVRGKYAITCPNAHEHTGQSDKDTEAVYWEIQEGHAYGGFNCQHSHCSDIKAIEFYTMIGIPLIQYHTPGSIPGPCDPPTGLHLDLSPKGGVLNTAENVYKILLGDPNLGIATLRYNEMTEREEIGGRDFEDRDYFDVRMALNDKYGLSFFKQHVYDAVDRAFRDNPYNPLTDCLNALKWDGIPRAETITIDYLKAGDDPYTRETIRKWLLGAIYRAYEPGCKFDNVIVFTGNEGIGKSTFVRRLGEAFGAYFGELTTVDEKLAMEKLHGCWVVEIPEMMVTDKHSMEAVKAFISSLWTRLRAAYGRKSQIYLRKFVMAGTSNREGFLISGNDRRFWPCSCGLPPLSFYDDAGFVNALPQVWAEVVTWYKAGEPLTLSSGVAPAAKGRQTAALEIHDDEWKGVIETYLGAEGGRGNGQTNACCRATIWRDIIQPHFQISRDLTHRDRLRIGNIMSLATDWERRRDVKFPGMGCQTGWVRTASDGEYAPSSVGGEY